MEAIPSSSAAVDRFISADHLPRWRRYVFSTDHKVIGIQYAVSGFIFFALWVLSDDVDALAAGLSRQAASVLRQTVRHFDAGRDYDARVL